MCTPWQATTQLPSRCCPRMHCLAAIGSALQHLFPIADINCRCRIADRYRRLPCRCSELICRSTWRMGEPWQAWRTACRPRAGLLRLRRPASDTKRRGMAPNSHLPASCSPRLCQEHPPPGAAGSPGDRMSSIAHHHCMSSLSYAALEPTSMHMDKACQGRACFVSLGLLAHEGSHMTLCGYFNAVQWSVKLEEHPSMVVVNVLGQRCSSEQDIGQGLSRYQSSSRCSA